MEANLKIDLDEDMVPLVPDYGANPPAAEAAESRTSPACPRGSGIPSRTHRPRLQGISSKNIWSRTKAQPRTSPAPGSKPQLSPGLLYEPTPTRHPETKSCEGEGFLGFKAPTNVRREPLPRRCVGKKKLLEQLQELESAPKTRRLGRRLLRHPPRGLRKLARLDITRANLDRFTVPFSSMTRMV